ncbi:hypothetical protein PMAYCL1PPCAC_15625, partial [Pristionchus mayeri]
MTMSIFLPLSTQSQIYLYYDIMFVLAILFNAIGLVLLLKRTPPNQYSIRKYLVLIQKFRQILLFLTDVHLEIGFHPIPAFPALAVYANGYLIQLGASVHLEIAISSLLYGYIGIAILLCVLFRHQTVILNGSRFKLSQVWRIFF